jgi:hypothetical protein
MIPESPPRARGLGLSSKPAGGESKSAGSKRHERGEKEEEEEEEDEYSSDGSSKDAVRRSDDEGAGASGRGDMAQNRRPLKKTEKSSARRMAADDSDSDLDSDLVGVVGGGAVTRKAREDWLARYFLFHVLFYYFPPFSYCFPLLFYSSGSSVLSAFLSSLIDI